MDRQPHPISDLVLRAIVRDAEGRAVLPPATLATVRGALQRLATSPELRPAVLTLVELAHLLETRERSPAPAAALRALADETVPLLRAQARHAQEGRADDARQRHDRFTAMVGGPQRGQVIPLVVPRKMEAMRVSQLAPARVIR